MNISRRNFMMLGGMSALAMQGITSAVFGQTDFAAAPPVRKLESFRALVGTDFYIASEKVTTTIKLTNIKESPHKTKNGESFTMEFKVPQNYAKEDTYHVWHPQMGNFDLFMTAGKTGKRKVLIAVINRL